MKLTVFLIFTLIYLATKNGANSATPRADTPNSRILFLYPIATHSETILFLPIAKGLAAKGHAVTIVTPIHTENLGKNLREIVPTTPMKDLDFFVTDNIMDERKLAKERFRYLLSFDFSVFTRQCHEVFNNEEFKKLLDEDFDLIYMSALANECLEGLVHKFQVPYILLSSMPAFHDVVERTGLRVAPSYIPSPIFDFTSKMNFPDRFVNTIMVWLTHVLMSASAADYEQIYRQYLGQDCPGLHEIENHLSLVMSNSHPLLNFARPGLPDFIEIGGIHCRAANPLPKDLNDFMNNSKEGVVLFSLGSVLQSKTLPDHVRKIFINVFSKLKMKVLWKWDSLEMTDLPPNVKLVKWLPQQDILGHPNLKLFISHGGLLSTQESTYHGVPMLGIPLFVDQDVNIKQAVENGYALMEEILEMTEESLGDKINRMLTDPSFAASAKKASAIFRDSDVSPMDRAIYWVEFILRHKGAPHLKSPARQLNFFQYHSLDVVGVIVLTLVALLSAIVWTIRKICCGGKNPSKSKINLAQKKKS